MFSKLGNKSTLYILLGGLLLSIGLGSFVFLFGILPSILSRQSTPAENINPSYENVAPSDQDTNPAHENITPTNQDINPAYENVDPSPPNITPTEPVVNPSYQDVASMERYVIVNEIRLSDEELRILAEMYGITVGDGEYWYDPYSGAWGMTGGPIAGFIMSNLNIGGPLQPDASGGGTFIFLNGRELHPQDIHYLEAIVGVIPYGRYWLDPYGNMGYEGYGATVNIIQASSSVSGTPNEYGSNPYYYHNDYTGNTFSSNGDEYYFYDSESGCSVMDGEVIC